MDDYISQISSSSYFIVSEGKFCLEWSVVPYTHICKNKGTHITHHSNLRQSKLNIK